MIRAGWCLSIFGLLLSGCALGPEPVAPTLHTPAGYATQIEMDLAATTEPWWQGFADPALNRLIDAAVTKNFDIRIAQAQLQQARSTRLAARADLLPDLDAYVEAEWLTMLAGDSGIRSERQAGAALGFDVDLFGRLRRSLQFANAEVAGAAMSIQDLRRIVAQSVALRYIEMRRAQARLGLLTTTLEVQTRTLEIVQSRQRAGLSPKLDVDRAAADLAGSRAQQGSLLEVRQNTEYALSVLVGDVPQRWAPVAAANVSIPSFQAGPPLGLPADLLRRRPDVRAAEFALVAQIAQIGVETADLYPRLSLPGIIQADIGSGGSIADMASVSLGALLDLPLLDGGRRRAEVAAQEARAQEALLQYQQTLLFALEDVESALVRITMLLDRQRNLAAAVAASQSAFQQLDALYREGLAGFIDVLDVQRTLIASQENYVDSEAALASAYVLLYAALGDYPD